LPKRSAIRQRLLLAEGAGHHAVDLACALQVVAERLFEHQPHLRTVDAGAAELLHHHREQLRRGGQEHHHRAGATLVEPGLQARVVLGLREVHAAVVQQLGKTRELLATGLLGLFDTGKALLDVGAVLGIAALVAGHREDASALGQLAMAPGLEQRRHQLAPGEIASAAKENEVECHGRMRPRAAAVVTQLRDG
jgi:hypothetical protein